MAITPTFRMADIDKFIENKFQRIDQAIISRFQFIGEAFVKNARENGEYKDQTGNLRNSIGYIILKDGVEIKSNFKKSATVVALTKNGKQKTTTGATDGLNKGMAYARELGQKHLKGYCLIVVAGMEYAMAVEARGKDVLTASGITAKNDLKRAIESLKNKINLMK
jgi:hypothetical protein